MEVQKGKNMKIVVIGGSGLIGGKLVSILSKAGHEVVAASPRTGVNSLTGAGLAEALAGAGVVVDVANSPSFEDRAVLAFFETSTRNLLAAEATAGVGHHVALSVVGADRNTDSGYMRAKAAQERLIRDGGTPYTILRATQFFEFVDGIAESGVVGDEIRLTPALMQPVAADDVAATLADVVTAPPVNGVVELGGPEALPLVEFVRRRLEAKRDPRVVVADPEARYFGERLDDGSLTTGETARLGAIRFEDWLARSAT